MRAWGVLDRAWRRRMGLAGRGMTKQKKKKKEVEKKKKRLPAAVGVGLSMNESMGDSWPGTMQPLLGWLTNFLFFFPFFSRKFLAVGYHRSLHAKVGRSLPSPSLSKD